MKTYFLRFKKLISGFFFGVVVLSITFFTSCGGEDCTGCTAASPWSKPSAGSCYATQTDCERAEGGTCEICN